MISGIETIIFPDKRSGILEDYCMAQMTNFCDIIIANLFKDND